MSISLEEHLARVEEIQERMVSLRSELREQMERNEDTSSTLQELTSARESSFGYSQKTYVHQSTSATENRVYLAYIGQTSN